MQDYYSSHHGILGQKWGVRRYQNSDGTLTAAGRRHIRQIEKKDAKWARKNYDRIYKNAYKKSRQELNDYLENDLNKRILTVRFRLLMLMSTTRSLPK